MADKKISQLTAATTPLAGTEVLPIVQSGSTVKVANNDLRPKQIQSNATTGVLQVVGPAAAATRVMTTPDANFTVARTDAGQTFTGDEVFSTSTAFSRGNDSTTGIKIGAIDTGGSTMFRTPSVNGAYSSGLVVDGAYSSALSTINLRAIGVNSGGGYSSKFALWTTYETTTTKVVEIDNNGNYTPQIAAKGVNFTANTPAAGMTSQLLNWYEEGTWTGTLTAATPPTTPVTATGRYTRIGRQVTVNIEFDNKNTTGASGAMSVTGLPFTAGSAGYGPTMKNSMGTNVITAAVFSGNTKVDFSDAADMTNFNIVAATGIYLRFSVTYFV